MHQTQTRVKECDYTELPLNYPPFELPSQMIHMTCSNGEAMVIPAVMELPGDDPSLSFSCGTKQT